MEVCFLGHVYYICVFVFFILAFAFAVFCFAAFCFFVAFCVCCLPWVLFFVFNSARLFFLLRCCFSAFVASVAFCSVAFAMWCTTALLAHAHISICTQLIHISDR